MSPIRYCSQPVLSRQAKRNYLATIILQFVHAMVFSIYHSNQLIIYINRKI